MLHYLRIWFASARYSITRMMMFRGDFIVWSLVELFWMTVNLLVVQVLFEHTTSIAGWTKYQMVLLVGSSMMIQRLLMGFFWSSIFEMGRNIRSGNFDFFLAQPGNVMFMATTRKLDPDGLINSVIAGAVVYYATGQLGIVLTWSTVALYACMILAGLVIHYSILVLSIAPAFWLTSAQGIEGGYFTLTEFSRLPRQVFKGVARVIFVWLLPVVVVSNCPAELFKTGGVFNLRLAGALFGFAAIWLTVAIVVFHRGLRRYASASS